MVFDDGDFFYDENNEDVQMTMMEQAQYNIFDTMEKTIKDIKMNIKLKEQSDVKSNLHLLAGYFDSALKIQELMGKENNLSEEEIKEILDGINRSTTELTFSNINDIVIDQNEEQEEVLTTESDDTDNDRSLDF